ncbi:MAG: hypothetical protein EOO77_12235 [Oxalobacteraceae bacterium]|nr:MAG: hypothetical protein EOO77_12235 [Oxalobacteraceae bacterium]
MSANMQVVLEGLPECVQETADMLDRAFPGLMTWQRFAIPARDCVIRLQGVGAVRNTLFPRPPRLTDQAPALGKAWKLSPAASGAVPRRSRSCAFLSKGFVDPSRPIDMLPGVTDER